MLPSLSEPANGIVQPLSPAECGVHPRERSGTSPGSRCVLITLVLLGLCLSGCHGANHYYAEQSVFGERLPDTLRLAERTNPQTVDLSKLASGTGGSETIGVGDVLEIKISAGLSGDDQSTMASRVASDGTISLPEIGPVQVAGIEPQGVESLIRSEAIRRELYRNPTVTVFVAHQRMNKVRVIGAVEAPGVYELPPNASDVVSAIASAGGLADDAGQTVEVRNPARAVRMDRPAVAGDPGQPLSTVSNSNVSGSNVDAAGMNSYSIDLISAARAGDGQYLVQDGGVVMVEKRDPAPVYIGGLVKSAGRYDFPIGQDLHLLDAVALAGGMSNQLADKIYVVRQVADAADPAVIQISYRAAKKSADSNIRLGPGDVVSVEHTPSTVVMEALNIIRFGISGSTALF